LLVPSVDGDQIGPEETKVLADALATAVAALVPEGAS
jgi:hypothetical protein